MHHEVLDFNWECMDSLRYFKLYLPKNLTTEIIEVITRKLSEMPSLKKLKYDQLLTHKKQVYTGSHTVVMTNSNFNKTPEETMDP